MSRPRSIAPSLSNPPMGIDLPRTMPPMARTAISEVPPPTSTTRFPSGSWMGSPAPTAAASGSSISAADFAPAATTASSTARRSTGVSNDGTQTSTRGLARRPAPTFRRTSRIISRVSSKSVIAPRWTGRLVGCSRAHHPMGVARGKPLLLPYRDVPLDALDAVPAGLEGLRPVGRGAAHHDRRLAHLQAAGSVEDRDLQDRPPFEHLLPDGLEVDTSLLVPRLVVQAGHLAALRVIPNGSDEQHGSPGRGVGNEHQRLSGVEGWVGEPNAQRGAPARESIGCAVR